MAWITRVNTLFTGVAKTDNALLWRGQASKERLLDPEETTQILRTVDSSSSFDEVAYQLRRPQTRHRSGFRGS